MSLLQKIAHLVAAPVCALCGAPGQSLGETWGLDLCPHCERACRPVHPACPRCALPLEIRPAAASGAAATPCPECAAHPPPFDAAHALFRYQEPADQLITGLKFQHDLVFARVLGMLLARSLTAGGRTLPDCIVPLPLHATRYRERGFCQTTEIARHLVPRLRDAQGRRPRLHHGLLRRARATLPQSGLAAAARATNLQSAFEIAERGVPRHIALLDDVMTTGHTAAAAARCLKRGGALRVDIWCCARAVRATAGSDPIW